ncbi:hypothetical protein L249_6080 [Ophiocordyceps polyrhachis-furcata BCC 54312]|uniref:AGC-kinase C-terminal domain-containing protein n=1 Tax=Ophiocordyceps polyrhachis-furcata BCC 54312 TaxID=1330021 RepID=A0A367LIQ6_9HYPO|nr:hypothetical protein L249_6080 [Ophiocordyceps polyrhachis-furcata BCC 54312]
MLSHLRFHRRGASNPVSPSPNQPRPWSPPAVIDSSYPGIDADDASSSSSSALPPTLPPIPSVTSAADWPSTQPHGDIASTSCTSPGDAKSPQVEDLASSPNLSKRLPPRPLSAETEATSSSHTGPATSFSTPTELQRSARSWLPPETTAPTSTAHVAEPPKTRKSLPFLKSSMSTLLMRRKNNHNVPELRPLPVKNRPQEPVYDPRIRGTRVHDFSAPRRKHHEETRFSDDTKPSAGLETHGLRTSGSASDSARSMSLDTTSSPAHPSPSVSSARTKASSIDQGLVSASDEPRPPVPPKDRHPLHYRPLSPVKAADTGAEQSQQTTPARCNTQTSRDFPMQEISAVPRHMKSTSSRFSFDMIGAAGQEKLLEERHRQRESEKKTTGVPEARDSIDYERDSIDYDALMDDEGLEERIPGVNADAEEEEEELEQQEGEEEEVNFGDGHDLSNTVSSLASSNIAGVSGTSRDDDGQSKSFVISSQATSSPCSSCLSPKTRLSSLNEGPCGMASGLGIRPRSFSFTAPQTVSEDDLYFDDGYIDPSGGEFAEDLATEPEFCGVPFDESIFDNNDTDQFGRPVPGAFAQAQMMRRAAAKRDSDVTSGTSVPSALLRSTAHTSPLIDAQGEAQSQNAAAEAGDDKLAGLENCPLAAYQAALAAAAHEAAASGKFQRSSSPGQFEGEPPAPFEASLPAIRRTEFDDDGDEMEYDDVDDDDAIIAEANASALAYDSDGWYGQEFGFYSNPAGHNQLLHAFGSSKFSNYEFANGGVFGPNRMADLDHSASGRMISREPNLTPITERSEYSNRNSLMSLGVPPFSSSTPAVQSPGLSQLAAVGEQGDEQMTLSALLRLRSKAWGGSQASLTSSKDGSPRSERAVSPWGLNAAGSLPYQPGEHRRRSSLFSTASPDSEDVSECGSPTLTMAGPLWSEPTTGTTAVAGDYRPTSNATSRRSSWDVEDGKTGDGRRRSWKGHRRQRSSTDSVSYFKEEEGGETRWVMERRRTGESGEVEILEREMVEGGRI